MHRPSLPRDTQRGFTLVEVLIAALVLAIGLLGLAALSVTTLKLTGSAMQRTQATQLAYFIVDAMRANSAVSYAGSYVAPACNASFIANAGSVRANDLAEWLNYLACTLTAAEANIQQDANGDVTVTICWDESRVDQFTADQPLPTDPLCAAAGIDGTMSFRVETEL